MFSVQSGAHGSSFAEATEDRVTRPTEDVLFDLILYKYSAPLELRYLKYVKKQPFPSPGTSSVSDLSS
jgi:hypothetical protein